MYFKPKKRNRRIWNNRQSILCKEENNLFYKVINIGVPNETHAIVVYVLCAYGYSLLYIVYLTCRDNSTFKFAMDD